MIPRSTSWGYGSSLEDPIAGVFADALLLAGLKEFSWTICPSRLPLGSRFSLQIMDYGWSGDGNGIGWFLNARGEWI